MEMQAQIQQLRDDLYMARRAIIELMSPEAQWILESHYNRPEGQSVWQWAESIAEKVIDLCEDVQQTRHGGEPIGAPRAYCPLCGDGSQSFYEKGFALPTGLYRHLIGYGNMRQCDVISAAIALAKASEDRRR